MISENNELENRMINRDTLQDNGTESAQMTQKAEETKAEKTQKIVVLGGSFNPPTLAHAKLLTAALDALGADAGIFVPSSDAYVRRKLKKQGQEKWLLSEQQRLDMLKAVCCSDRRLRVSDCEYRDDGRGHSYDTMVKLQTEYPDALLYCLVGGDKLNVVGRWHNSRAFFESFNFAVVKRDGTEPEKQLAENPFLAAHSQIFHIVPEPEGIAGISSSVVRSMFEQGDSSVREMLFPDVYGALVKAGWNDMDITAFREKYHFLSNFYEAPVKFEGIQYPNNEAAFQAQKCLSEEEKLQFTELSPGRAKSMGRRVQLRSDWEQVKDSLMEDIVRAKFTQNPWLGEALLATCDRKLVEGNTWHDTYWGVDASSGKGENRLGKILMKIREELREHG